MARLIFNNNYEVDDFTYILSKKNYEFIGKIPFVTSARYKCNFNSADEISFTVTKYEDIYDENYDEYLRMWEEITDLKVVYVPELSKCFSITVSLQDSRQVTKNITGTELGEVELSQIMIYDVDVNNDNDNLFKESGIPTLFYRDLSSYTIGSAEYEQAKNTSLLHRVLNKAPHYSIGHVDDTLKNLKRVATFSINDTSIYDFLSSTLATEFHCILKINSLTRTIDFYDLYQYCEACGERSEYINKECPKCGSTGLKGGYGKNTTIFVNKDNLADTITYEVDVDSVKNCFRLSAGDDLMTDTIANANPSGRYIYYITDEQKNEMPDRLRTKLNAYDKRISEISSTYLSYSNQIYDLIDKINYYEHSLMPTVSTVSTNATTEAAKIFSNGSSHVGKIALDIDLTQYTGLATVTSAVKNKIKTLIKTAYVSYDIDAKSFTYKGTKTDSYYGSYEYGLWVGDITVTNRNDEDDEVKISDLTIEVNDIYPEYVLDEVAATRNALDNDLDEDEYLDIPNIAKADFENFKKAITADSGSEDIAKYSLSRLTSLIDGLQSIIDIFVEEDQADEGSELYSYYKDYKDKHAYATNLFNQLATKVEQLNVDLITVKKNRSDLQQSVEIESYLGEEDYKIFCTYKREQSYSNSNFISDGLDNSELYENATIFLEEAKKELYKSAEYQHKIASDLKNLLLIPEFEPLIANFDVGNWIQVQVEDNIYMLRLMSYEISFESLQTITVEFSDVTKSGGAWSDVASILSSAKSMASNYSYVTRQSEKGYIAHSTFKEMQDEGFNSALYNIKTSDREEITIDKHGILCRSYGDLKDDYDDRQLKILKNCIAFTQDNWETLKTAIGQFTYKDPTSGKTIQTYGVNAETLIGELILGSRLGIYSSDDKVEMTFDNDGLVLNTKRYSSTDDYGLSKDLYKSIFRIEVDGSPVLYVNNEGKLILESAEFTDLKDSIDQTIGNIQEEFCIYSSSKSLPDNYLKDQDEYLTNAYAKQYWYPNILSVTNENPYLWKRTKVIYKSSEVKSTFGVPYCVNGVKGDSLSVTDSWTRYLITSNALRPERSRFMTQEKDVYPSDIPMDSYVWSLTYVSYSDGSKSETYSVSHIGKDGDAVYTWIAYADDINGNGISKSSTYYNSDNELCNKEYIGLAPNMPTDEWDVSNATDVSKFSWSKFKGDDSESYLWIKYANAKKDSNGNDIFKSNGVPDIDSTTMGDAPYIPISETYNSWEKTGTISLGIDEFGNEQFEDEYGYVERTKTTIKYRDYIGISKSNKQEESNDVNDYTWSLVKGDQGLDGKFLWIKYSKYPDGINPKTKKADMSDYPDTSDYIYMGISNVMHDKPESEDKSSKLASSYTWKKYIGSDGETMYTWIKYADAKVNEAGDFYYDSNNNIIMENLSDEPTYEVTSINAETGLRETKTVYRKYIGIANNRAVSEKVNGTPSEGSEDYKTYTWSLIQGEQGDQGITHYVWTMYSDDNTNHNNMYPSPLYSSKYMGVSYDNIVSQEAVLEYKNQLDSGEIESDSLFNDYYNLMMSANEYYWVQYMGDQYYMWVRYSEYPDGIQRNADGTKLTEVDSNGNTVYVYSMSTNSEGKSYIGLKFNQLEDDTCDAAQKAENYDWKYIEAQDPKEIVNTENEWCLSSSSELIPVYEEMKDDNGNVIKDSNGNVSYVYETVLNEDGTTSYVYLTDSDGNYIDEDGNKVSNKENARKRVVRDYQLKIAPERIELKVDSSGDAIKNSNGDYEYDIFWGYTINSNGEQEEITEKNAGYIDMDVDSTDWKIGDPDVNFNYSDITGEFIEEHYMYLWSRTRFTYSDGSKTTTTPVCSKNLKDLILGNESNKELLKKYGNWISLDNNHIELGNKTSDNIIRIDQEGIFFTKKDTSDSQATSYWDGDYLNTGNLVVKSSERAQFGRFAFIPREDKSLMFLMVGEYQRSNEI